MRRIAAIFVGLLGTGASLLPAGALWAANCTVTATSVAFGRYDPLTATPRNRNGRISVTCSGNGTFTVALSTGQSGSYNPRYMLGGSANDQLDYNLIYQRRT